jgi:hypothetical protein
MTLGDQALWVCDKGPMIIAGNATAKYKQYVEFSMKEINNYGGIIIYPKTIKSINGTVINT